MKLYERRSSHIFDAGASTFNLVSVTTADADAHVTFNCSDASEAAGIVLRAKDEDTCYIFRYSGGMMQIVKKSGGHISTLRFRASSLHSGSLRAQVIGSTLRMRWWAGDLEPDTWMLVGQDEELTSGAIGLFGYGNVTFDNFLVTDTRLTHTSGSHSLTHYLAIRSLGTKALSDVAIRQYLRQRISTIYKERYPARARAEINTQKRKWLGGRGRVQFQNRRANHQLNTRILFRVRARHVARTFGRFSTRTQRVQLHTTRSRTSLRLGLRARSSSQNSVRMGITHLAYGVCRGIYRTRSSVDFQVRDAFKVLGLSAVSRAVLRTHLSPQAAALFQILSSARPVQSLSFQVAPVLSASVSTTSVLSVTFGNDAVIHPNSTIVSSATCVDASGTGVTGCSPSVEVTFPDKSKHTYAAEDKGQGVYQISYITAGPGVYTESWLIIDSVGNQITRLNRYSVTD